MWESRIGAWRVPAGFPVLFGKIVPNEREWGECAAHAVPALIPYARQQIYSYPFFDQDISLSQSRLLDVWQ